MHSLAFAIPRPSSLARGCVRLRERNHFTCSFRHFHLFVSVSIDGAPNKGKQSIFGCFAGHRSHTQIQLDNFDHRDKMNTTMETRTDRAMARGNRRDHLGRGPSVCHFTFFINFSSFACSVPKLTARVNESLAHQRRGRRTGDKRARMHCVAPVRRRLMCNQLISVRLDVREDVSLTGVINLDGPARRTQRRNVCLQCAARRSGAIMCALSSSSAPPARQNGVTAISAVHQRSSIEASGPAIRSRRREWAHTHRALQTKMNFERFVSIVRRSPRPA